MPLIRRLPKRGFNNAAFHKHYAIVNLGDLNAFEAGTAVNERLLRDANLVRGNVAGLKILGGGELKHRLTIEADKVSASAREKIEKAGGSVTLREARAPRRKEDQTAGATASEAPDTSASTSSAPVKKAAPAAKKTPAKKKAPAAKKAASKKAAPKS